MARAEHKCQRCNELITEVINKLRNYCVQNDCCWEREYNVSFPTNVCSFSKQYKTLLSRISSKDKKESRDATITWNKCVKPNIESISLCERLGKCKEKVPGPANHARMVDWCNGVYPKNSDQDTCWECISENSDCGFFELSDICESMTDCRGDSFFSILDNPNPELLQCLDSFSGGECCSPKKIKTTKGMTRTAKNAWWEEFASTGNFPEST